jgi:WD40 repeat protein
MVQFLGSTSRLWDVSSGKEVRKLAIGKKLQLGAMRTIGNLAFSPSGRLLAVSSEETSPGGGAITERGIGLWDPATGKELRRLPAAGLLHSGDLAFSPDSATLLAVGDDCTIRRWQVATGAEIAKFAIQAQLSGDARAFSADGVLVASSGYDGVARIWDSATGRRVLDIPTPENMPHFPVFSPDRRYLALCGAAYRYPYHDQLAIELWELASGRLVQKYAMPPRTGASSVAFARDGRTLVTGMADTTALLWDLAPSRADKAFGRLEDCWAALAQNDAPRAYAAIWRLGADPQRGLALLNDKLKPVLPAPVEVTRLLLKDLDNEVFKVREAAMKKLEALGERAEPALRAALKTSPSLETQRRLESLLERVSPSGPLQGEALRGVRAVQVLEKMSTREARSLLEHLAEGMDSVSLTRSAKESLARMALP